MKTNLLLKITLPLAALILTAGVYAQEEKLQVIDEDEKVSAPEKKTEKKKKKGNR